jgi:hypothetical protein
MDGEYQGNRAVRGNSRDEGLQGMFGQEQDEPGRSDDRGEEDADVNGKQQPVWRKKRMQCKKVNKKMKERA